MKKPQDHLVAETVKIVRDFERDLDALKKEKEDVVQADLHKGEESQLEDIRSKIKSL